MKFKTTQKAIKANYNTIICVPYCGLQNLLNYESPVAYTERREGWAADILRYGRRGCYCNRLCPIRECSPVPMNCGNGTKRKPKKFAIFPVMRKSGTHCGNYNGYLLRR